MLITQTDCDVCHDVMMENIVTLDSSIKISHCCNTCGYEKDINDIDDTYISNEKR